MKVITITPNGIMQKNLHWHESKKQVINAKEKCNFILKHMEPFTKYVKSGDITFRENFPVLEPFISYKMLQTPWSRVLLEKSLVAQLVKKFPPLMEPKSSLPCSQEPTTGLYPDSDPVHTFLPYFPKIHFNIILPSTARTYEFSFPLREAAINYRLI
jgi:hypothetical protein